MCDTAPGNGWTFLADADAGLKSAGTELVTRKEVPETLKDLFALRRRIIGQVGDAPYVEEEEPAVCSWLPTAKKALVWNLSEQEVETVRYRGKRIPVEAGPLELGMVGL